MTDSGAMQPGTEAQNAAESAPLRRLAAKDLSLVTLVPKWGGTDKSIPLAEFLDSIDGTANIGNWTEADKMQVCVLRLTDNARDFYRATPELRDPTITWENFKEHFLKRFRDVRTNQYHFTQLQQAKQRKEESSSEFLDRCKILARKTVPCVPDANMQRAYNEQADRMLLAAFCAGLSGTPGREVRMRAPLTTDEAIRIAVGVEQAEVQERRNNAFYTDSEVDVSPSGRVQERSAKHTNVGNTGTRPSPGFQASSRVADHRRATRNAQAKAPVKCYECSGYGHFVSECPNRKRRQEASSAKAKVVNPGAKNEGHKKGRERGVNRPAEN